MAQHALISRDTLLQARAALGPAIVLACQRRARGGSPALTNRLTLMCEARREINVAIDLIDASQLSAGRNPPNNPHGI